MSGCGWCAAISKCLFNEKLCEVNLTTKCDIPVPCTDEEWLAEPSPYSAFDYLCAQEVGDTIIENGDCFDCDLCVPAVGRADCTAKSGCFWCAASFSCTSNNSGCAAAVAAGCEDLTSLSGFVFNDPALPAQLWHLRAVNVEPAWVAGFTGAGINILFIDDPADISHSDLVGKHVVNGSTTNCQTQGFNGYHGLICATLAVAAANNSACGAGVSYDATFSQGWMLDAVERFTAGVDNGLAHVHSKSHAVVSCYEYDLTSP